MEKDNYIFEINESSNKVATQKAKKDHVILQNDFRVDIKKGDDLSEIPERFYDTLKTEKII